LPGYVAVNVPKELRDRFERLAGKYTGELSALLIEDPAYQDMPFDHQTDFLMDMKAMAMDMARMELQAETGEIIPETYETFRQKLLPAATRQLRAKELEEVYGITPEK